ncbi:MAG: hypothetical protein QOH00_745, partial [Gaiellales bacterium]|nr:hypothetical protein [Gaiellales bacterium]
LFDDLLSSFVPHERLRIFIPVAGPDLDCIDEIEDAGEGAAA